MKSPPSPVSEDIPTHTEAYRGIANSRARRLPTLSRLLGMILVSTMMAKVSYVCGGQRSRFVSRKFFALYLRKAPQRRKEFLLQNRLYLERPVGCAMEFFVCSAS